MTSVSSNLFAPAQPVQVGACLDGTLTANPYWKNKILDGMLLQTSNEPPQGTGFKRIRTELPAVSANAGGRDILGVSNDNVFNPNLARNNVTSAGAVSAQVGGAVGVRMEGVTNKDIGKLVAYNDVITDNINENGVTPQLALCHAPQVGNWVTDRYNFTRTSSDFGTPFVTADDIGFKVNGEKREYPAATASPFNAAMATQTPGKAEQHLLNAMAMCPVKTTLGDALRNSKPGAISASAHLAAAACAQSDDEHVGFAHFFADALHRPNTNATAASFAQTVADMVEKHSAKVQQTKAPFFKPTTHAVTDTLPPPSERNSAEAEYAAGLTDPAVQNLVRERHPTAASHKELMDLMVDDLKDDTALAHYVTKIKGGAGVRKPNIKVLQRVGDSARVAKTRVGHPRTREEFTRAEFGPHIHRAIRVGHIDADLGEATGVTASPFTNQWDVPDSEEWVEHPLGKGLVRTRVTDTHHELQVANEPDIDSVAGATRADLGNGNSVSSDWLQFVGNQPGVYRFPKADTAVLFNYDYFADDTNEEVPQLEPNFDVPGQFILGRIIDVVVPAKIARVVLQPHTANNGQYICDYNQKHMPAARIAAQQSVIIQVEIKFPPGAGPIEAGTLIYGNPEASTTSELRGADDPIARALYPPTKGHPAYYDKANPRFAAVFLGVAVDTVPPPGKKQVARVSVAISGAIGIRVPPPSDRSEYVVNDHILLDYFGHAARVVAVDKRHGPYVQLMRMPDVYGFVALGVTTEQRANEFEAVLRAEFGADSIEKLFD